MKKVAWFSCGCSSFLSCWLLRDSIDEIIYTHVPNQHPDSLRFLHDCELLLDRKITILQNDFYKDIYDVFKARHFINSIHGAPCTREMKRQVRKRWEYEHPDNYIYVWGFDCTERKRANNLVQSMEYVEHEFPLIDHNLNKSDVHGYCQALGLKRPLMYDLGYNNNNCVGCVKGGQGYWNKIRVDFPDVFNRMALLERELDCSCINGIFLDELSPSSGRTSKIILPECDIFCQINTNTY